MEWPPFKGRGAQAVGRGGDTILDVLCFSETCPLASSRHNRDQIIFCSSSKAVSFRGQHVWHFSRASAIKKPNSDPLKATSKMAVASVRDILSHWPSPREMNVVPRRRLSRGQADEIPRSWAQGTTNGSAAPRFKEMQPTEEMLHPSLTMGNLASLV